LKIEEEATSVHCRDSLADQVIARALDVNHGSSNSQGAGVRSIPNREEHPPLDRSAGAEGASLSAVPHLTPLTGLTSVEATLRIDRGQTNDVRMGTSRTLSEILRANILTRFNLILGSLLALILAIGPIQDALFGIVLVVNALVGIVQELRAKRTLDRLAILNEPRARLMRNGVLEDAPIKAVVLDDLVHVRTGDQIVADGIVRATEGLQIDESLLTGESEPVQKSVNDSILSGSFVVAGSCDYQATGVGLDAYAATLAVAARRFKLTSSELMEGINRLLRYVTWAIFPVAGLLLWSQLRSTPNWRDAASGVVAGLIAMVPQGLVLLTSIAFAIAVVTLARRNVLVQELPAVEVLARVDIVCIDKTGTLTDGTIIFDRVERLDKDFPIDDALGALGHGGDSNATLGAIGAALANPAGWCRTDSVPFSSARKWSGATFTDHGTVILGAPELIADVNDDVAVLASGAELAKTGLRVLLLASTDDPLDQETLPRGLRPLAFVLLREKVRPDAAETLAFFVQQGVAIKVISGDSPHTVGAVAALVGVAQAGEPVDARELPDDLAELGLVLEQRSVFGRVTPQQKQTMVAALQARGHTVAMTGDGVNDALALKTADIGIAMGSGAPATRAVAQVVLLDGRFATLPGVVAEGRRVTANIERVSNLFITKTVWATFLAIAVGVARWPYPLLPRHLTIIDALAIGIPAFFLALGPNARRYQPGFVDRVLRFALPAGLVVASSTFAAFWLARSHHLSLIQQRTSATLVGLMVSLCVLVLLALPLTWRRALLVGLMIASFLLLFPVSSIRTFYALELPHPVLGITMLIGFIGSTMLYVGWMVSRHSDRNRATANRTPTTK
jgi:cation-transporting ATPase E